MFDDPIGVIYDSKRPEGKTVNSSLMDEELRKADYWFGRTEKKKKRRKRKRRNRKKAPPKPWHNID